jgi:predicted DNA-binding protein
MVEEVTLFQRVDELETRLDRLIDIVAQINQALFAVERTTEGQSQLNSTFAEAILGLRTDLGHVASDLDGLDMKVDDLDEDIEDLYFAFNRLPCRETLQ